MGREKPFECEITVSPGVEDKLHKKHRIEIWEIEEVIYDDSFAFTMRHKDIHFVYGQTFSGRYLLVLVRILGPVEVSEMGYETGKNVLKIITARDMNPNQRKKYLERKGGRK